MKFLLPASLLCLAAAYCLGQTVPAAPEHGGVSFDFTPRPDAHAPSYIVAVNLQGDGRYIEFAADVPDSPATRPVLFKLTPRTLQRLLSAHDDVAARSHQGTCGTHLKNIASSGKKTLTFYDEPPIVCTFDYSDSPSINGVSDAFRAIAETIQLGQELEHAHRYDRLALDAEMESLTNEAAAGRAIEIQSIAPVLRSIAEDDHVIDRARRKAARLIQDLPVPDAPDSAR